MATTRAMGGRYRELVERWLCRHIAAIHQRAVADAAAAAARARMHEAADGASDVGESSGGTSDAAGDGREGSGSGGCANSSRRGCTPIQYAARVCRASMHGTHVGWLCRRFDLKRVPVVTAAVAAGEPAAAAPVVAAAANSVANGAMTLVSLSEVRAILVPAAFFSASSWPARSPKDRAQRGSRPLSEN